MLNSFLIAFDTGERILFLSVFRGFWWVVYHEYHLGCNLLSRFYWLAGWLAFRLDFMWLIGSHKNHRHPVIPHARSSFVVDRNVPHFANLDECFHCSKFLPPLWLILAIKASVSNVMGADLKSCLATFLIISWKLFLCQLLHFNSLYDEQAINWFQTLVSQERMAH